MKDKLVKNHHKGAYYRARQAGIGLLVGCAGVCLIAVPTYFAISANEHKLNAQSEDDEKEKDKNKESNLLLDSLLTYEDR